MSGKAPQSESLVSKRSQQAVREIKQLNAELQQLFERSTKNPPRVVSARSLEVAIPTHQTTTQERKTIKKTDLHPYGTASNIKSPPIRVKPAAEKVKPYNVEEAREYMRKQEEKRLNLLRCEVRSSKQGVKDRKQKLEELHSKTKTILMNNVKRARSRSKSKENISLKTSPTNKEHVSRSPDVISHLTSTSAMQTSKEYLHRNVTVRKSPRSLTSEGSTPILIITEDGDINKAAIKIQAAFKGFKQRKRFKKDLLDSQLNKATVEEPFAELVVPKWLQSKLSSAPYSVAKSFKRKLAFEATKSTENLLENGTQKEILKDSTKSSKNKDLRAFLSDKCLDLDLKKVEELNLMSKERALDSESDTSKNIPDLSTGSSAKSLAEDYALDINSKRLKELKLRSKNISVRPNQEKLNATFDTQFKRGKSVGKLPASLLETFQGKENVNSSRKSSSYNPTVDRSIELDSSREISLNSSRHLFNPNKMKDMLLLTALNDDLEAPESVRQSENALSLIKSFSQASKSKSKNYTLNNSEVELEFCSNVSKKPSGDDISNQNSSRKEYFLDFESDRNSLLHFDPKNQSQSDSEIFESTEKLSDVLSSTAVGEKVVPLKLAGESVTTTGNEINVRFHAEIHLLNDFNQSLHNLVGVEKSLNYLKEQNQNTKLIYQNQNTQTSTKSTPSASKNSFDIRTARSSETNILNASVDCSLLNDSIFDKFDRISNSNRDESHLNDTQVSTRASDNSFVKDGQENQRGSHISQEALSLQHFEQLIKDEDARRDYLKTIFEIRKGILLDRTKVELSMLEIKKNHLVETGQLSEASVIRKKQRGILIKLQHEKYEMQRLMQMQKAAWIERKNNLKEQQNVIKAQLTLNDDTTVAKIKKNHRMDRRSSGPLKVFAPVVSHRLSTSNRRSDNSVTSRCSSSVAEELIVTTSYHSDSVRLSDGSVTSVTQETENRKTTTVTTEQKHLDNDKVIITEVIDDTNKSQSVDDETGSNVKSLESVNVIRDEAKKADFGKDDALVATSQMDYFSMERMEEMAIVESQIGNNKRLLRMKEDALQKRRKAAEELLEWHQRLLEEEKKVAALEMAATSVITHRPSQQPQQKSTSFINHQLLWSGNKETIPSADNALSTRSDSNSSNVKTVQVNDDVELTSNDSYSREFDDVGDATDNMEDEEVSLKTVKSSELDNDANILKSQSTLMEIMHNISIISEELSEIHRISTGGGKLDIGEDVRDVNSDETEAALKTAEEEQSAMMNSGGAPNFGLEEAEIIEQNIRIIEKEIEELQSSAAQDKTEDAETTISSNLATDYSQVVKSATELIPIEEKGVENLEAAKVVEDMDVSSTKVSEIVENLSSIDLIEMSEDKTSEDEEDVSEINNAILDNDNKTVLEEKSYSRQASFEELQVNVNAEIDEDSVCTPQSFDFDDSIKTPAKSKSELLLSSNAPDILESINRNSEDIDLYSHSSSKMPEILENLNAAATPSESTSPSHSSEPSLEEPLLQIQEEFSEVSIDLPSSLSTGIAIATEDIINTVLICKQENSTSFDVLDESSVTNNNATFVIDKSANITYDVNTKEESESFEEDISTECNLQEDSEPCLLDVTLFNDSNKENKSPEIYKEFERLPSFYGGFETTKRSKSNEPEDQSGSSKTTVNVKKRVSEILADAKQKNTSDKSTRIQDLYTTTYDVSYTEKASEIVSDLDQLDPELISPKLVEVKAEELELLKKQWAIEQEIKQLEEQQLTEQREQLPYQYHREIPNKPPPPYTPPVNQLPSVTIPSAIPSDKTELLSVLPTISDYLYTCQMNKTLQSAEIPLDDNDSLEKSAEINELLFDLCKELSEAHYCQFGGMTDSDFNPSWMQSEETISSLKKPLDKEGLYEYLEERLMDMYAFKEVDVKESIIMRWSRKKRDHVDDVLVRELPADECNWTNFEPDELIVKDKLVEDLTDLLLKEVLGELKDWWTAKHT